MIIKRRHVSNKAGNPVNDWDMEIERECHESIDVIEDNGDFVIEDRKRSMYFIKNNNYGKRKNN